MDQRFNAFILVAETLSMKEAAMLAFVSQQCISGHIRGLEQEFQVSLFNRKPQLSLTPEGSQLLEILYEIRILEKNIHNSLKGTNKELVGKVSLGIPSSRYTTMTPHIVSAFKREYPSINLEVVSGFSEELVWKLERGTLDMAVTVQQEENKALVNEASIPDTFLLLVPDQLLKNCFPNNYSDRLKAFQCGVCLQDISRFPLIQYPPTSRLRCSMDRFSKRYGILFQAVFESNRMEIFDCLSRELQAVSMIPSFMLPATEVENRRTTPQKFLHFFPVILSPLDISLNISLVRHKTAFLSEYKKALIQVVKSVFAGYEKIFQSQIPSIAI